MLYLQKLVVEESRVLRVEGLSQKNNKGLRNPEDNPKTKIGPRSPNSKGGCWWCVSHKWGGWVVSRQSKRGDKDLWPLLYEQQYRGPSVAAPALKENSIQRHLFSSPTWIEGSQIKSKRISVDFANSGLTTETTPARIAEVYPYLDT